jgi:hypothetical protein
MALDRNQIEWSPASHYGANFCTHRLSDKTTARLEFKPTLGMQAFFMVFCFLTIALPVFFFLGFLAGEVPVYALLFASGVSFLFYHICRIIKKMTWAPNYFDRMNDTYYALEPAIFGVDKEIREAISSIQALQILPKRIHSSKNSYTAYELNLLLKSGDRRTVVSHASYDDIKKDAQTISMHLGLNIFEK